MASATPGNDSPKSRGRRVARPSGTEREQAILSATKELLVTKSIQEISIDELMKIVGISRPGFYFYFPSKESVLLALLDRVLEESTSVADELSQLRGDDPVELWRAGIAGSFQVFLDNRFVMVAASQAKVANPEIRQVWNAIIQHWIDRSVQLIEAEQRRGAASSDYVAEELAISLNLMNERVMFAACTNDGPRHVEGKVVDALLHVWLRSVYLTTRPPTFAQLPPVRRS